MENTYDFRSKDVSDMLTDKTPGFLELAFGEQAEEVRSKLVEAKTTGWYEIKNVGPTAAH